MVEKPHRITILAKSFSAAAMEFHRAKMAERGYRLEGRIEPAVFQMLEGEESPSDLFDGEPLFAVTFIRGDEG
jgi:hypothetical protein